MINNLYNDKKGFTLIEVIISVALSTIVMIAILETLTFTFVSFTNQNNIFTTTQEISIFMLNITKDIHNANTVSVTNNEVDITANNRQITYVYSNGTVTRNSKVLITGVSALQFIQTSAQTGSLISVTINKNGIEMRTTVYAK